LRGGRTGTGRGPSRKWSTSGGVPQRLFLEQREGGSIKRFTLKEAEGRAEKPLVGKIEMRERNEVGVGGTRTSRGKQ